MPEETFHADQQEVFQADPRAGRSGKQGGSKLLIGLLLGCGVMSLLCVGLCAGGGFAVYRWAKSAVVQDPVQIEAERNAIATIDIPEAFEPKILLRLDFPVLGEMGKFVVYTAGSDQDVLVLGDFSEEFTQGKSPEEIVADAGQNSEFSVEAQDLENATTETYEREIRGQTCRFEITTGTGKQSGEDRITVEGTFPGQQGMAFLAINTKAELLDADQAKALIDSIE